MFDQWLFFRFNLREETGFVSTSIDNRQPLESLNMSEVPLNNWESQIQMYIHFTLLSETKYYNIGMCCLSALRHNMTGWLWHDHVSEWTWLDDYDMIMCQSGHDWMTMTYDHVSEWTWLDGYDMIMCQSGHDWMAMTYDHVSEWTWLDGYDIWSCVRVDMTGWLWHDHVSESTWLDDMTYDHVSEWTWLDVV